MSEFRPGEIVDITIKGARVVEVCRHGDGNGDDLRFRYEALDGELWPSSIWSDAPGVTVERRAPAEWPPQPGDLWRDRTGEAWFAFRDKGADLMVPAYPVNASRGGCEPDIVLERLGPLTLVYREGGELS